MKLKYYMRGIGIGIIFSTIILSISHKNSTNTITDAEIIRRAEQLGMVKEENNPVNDLNELLNPDGVKDENKPTSIPTTPIPNDSSTIEDNIEEESNSDEIADANQDSEDKELADENKSQDKANTELETKSDEDSLPEEETKSDEEETDIETSKNEDIVNMIQITITKGMSSEDVSRILEEKGIIEDKKVFNKYLKDNGFSRVINYGTYNIAENASFYDIANLLVSK